jgi:hypothetical protein
MNPTDYGTIIDKFNNKFIIQLSTSNVLIVKENNNENFVKFFRKGELMFEFKDTRVSENTFIRTIQDQRYTFTDNKLISTEIMSTFSSVVIYNTTDINNNSVQNNPLNRKLENIINSIKNS